MSRSVTMPGPGCSGSITTAAPTSRWAIAAAASRRDRPGFTVRTRWLIPVLTCMRLPSSPSIDRLNLSLQNETSSCPSPAYYMVVRQTTLFRRGALFDEALEVIEQEYADETLSLGSVARSIAT